jgi:predicted NACHT family NTPase
MDIARVLPNFTERTFAELLKRDRVLIDAAQRTLESLDRIRSKIEDDKEAESAKFETEYRRAVIRNLNKLELFGVDLSPTSRSQPLSVAYVSLDVSGPSKDLQRNAIDIGGEEEQGEEDSEVESVEMALAGNKRLVIMGPAGAGKTTLMRWIAVRAASTNFEYPLDDWNAAVPFLVRLRQFGDSAFPRPESFPSLIAPSIADTMPKGWVHQRLHSGRGVIMVDGVDEVAESRRAEVQKWVKDLVDTFPECRFIVTSRPHAVEQGWLKSEGFDDADLQPMDLAGIETFIDHWHLAVAEEVRREDEIGPLERLATNLKITLRQNRAIRLLATNPLLCSVICALHRDTNEQLPEDRLDLYERCCSMLLERRDPESNLHISGYPRISYRQERSLLDDLAYWMTRNAWTEITLDLARDRFGKKIETFRSDGRDGVPLTGESALRFFLERSGILREPVKGKLDFAHRTFQEYMAASAAIAEGDIGLLLSHATDTQRREVVILGAGLARPKERTELICSLLKEGDSDRSGRVKLHLLAAACLDLAVNVDSSLRNEVERRIENLVPPKNASEAIQIAEAAGEMAVAFLRRGKDFLSARQSVACVRALARIGSLEAIEAIAEYANDYGSVLREVVRTSNRIDPQLFLDLIVPRRGACQRV